jgi:hypothetical protein
MLPGGACHYVFPIPREATFLPWGPKGQRKSPRGTGTWTREELPRNFQVAVHTYSPSPVIFAWVQALHLFHRLRSLCHHKLWLSDQLCWLKSSYRKEKNTNSTGQKSVSVNIFHYYQLLTTVPHNN